VIGAADLRASSLQPVLLATIFVAADPEAFRPAGVP
jgi:hypothetical protein